MALQKLGDRDALSASIPMYVDEIGISKGAWVVGLILTPVLFLGVIILPLLSLAGFSIDIFLLVKVLSIVVSVLLTIFNSVLIIPPYELLNKVDDFDDVIFVLLILEINAISPEDW